MSKFLSGADILGASLKYVDESVPEWPKNGEPGMIRLNELDAGETMEMTDAMNATPKHGMFIILVYTATDPESGARLFPLEGDADQKKEQLAGYVEALKRKSFRVLSRLQRSALHVNGMGPKARDEAKNVSSGVASDASPSDSPKS